jgi:hypothetical protein
MPYLLKNKSVQPNKKALHSSIYVFVLIFTICLVGDDINECGGLLVIGFGRIPIIVITATITVSITRVRE